MSQEPTGEEPAEPSEQSVPSEPAEVTDPDTARAEALEAEGAVPGVTEIRKPSTVGGVVYLLVLAAAVAGIVITASGAWRAGVSCLGAALLAAAAARLVLSDDNAGMLRARRRLLDVVVLAGAGVALLVLAATIPNQPL